MLILVYLLIAAHIVHWQLAGRTLAPLELHEVMFTAELGIVTAGFLFMAASVVLTGVFGRFFCGWGCHLMGLQELCAWLLTKVGIRRKPIRARLIAWAPFLVMGYMFVLPQIARMWQGIDHPGLRIADDSEPIASFTTTDFWRNLPDPWIAGATFLVCGFLAVYVLGSRGFCTFACPYGAVFRIMDRLAPGRIRLTGECAQCGTCTKVCSSGVNVHKEILVYGTVVDSRCMKDLDCVGACPHDAISYGFGKPAWLTRALPGQAKPPRQYEFTLGEELLMAGVFLATLLVFRGLYQQVPFLMSVGLGAIAAYAAVRCLRPARKWFLASAAAFFAFWGHSAVVQWSWWRGQVAYSVAREQPAGSPLRQAAAAHARTHLERVDRWSLFATAEAKLLLGWTAALTGDHASAERCIAAAVAVDPRNADAHYWHAGVLMQHGNRAAAIQHLQLAVQLAPRHAAAQARLAALR